MSKVVLTSVQKSFTDQGIQSTVSRAFELLDYKYPKKLETVIIKANLCYYWDYSTGETTDPRVISAIIDYLRAKFGQDLNIIVSEADATAMKTRHAFKILGYDKLCKDKNVELVNLCDGEIVEKETTVNGKPMVLPVHKILLDADLVINVPKMKVHNLVGMTCSLKNMFGAISKPRKFSYHPNLHSTIVGINKLVKSDICIVDGLIVHGKYAKKTGFILAGDDALATDFVVAKIMNFNPHSVSHLKLAEKEKVGNVNNIELIEDGISLKAAKQSFPQTSFLVHKISWALQLRLLDVYFKLSGDICPPFLKA
ncbi:MAG: DUF362 domain-containing protein [Candidatus Bathyarchaeota archaeon]|nr:MAG: DUF362 domain-containing protein [Candidatus Bathyarchaeota archaeon]